MKINKKGFTLAELLIVVAIIAVLVAIGIPIFTSQLEKSREAADAANIRVQYAQVMAEAITSDRDINIDGQDFGKIELRQKQADWQTEALQSSLKNFATIIGKPGTQAWVEYKTNTETAYIKFEEKNTENNSDSNPANNLLTNSNFSNGDTGWEIIHGKLENGKAVLNSSWQDNVLKQSITMQENKTYKIAIDIESCGANLVVKVTNRNGNRTYFEKNVTTSGVFYYEYTHRENLDNDIQISLTVPKEQKKNPVIVNSVSLTEVN